MDRLPIGYVFRPQDEEIVGYYLSKKIKGEPIPCAIIITTNLYELNPPELEALYKNDIGISKENLDDVYYFFTNIGKLKISGDEGKNIHRTVRGGEGFWKGYSFNMKQINGVNVYEKREFKYCVRDKKNETNWKMVEFKIVREDVGWMDGFGGSSSNTNVNLDWVLCKVYQVQGKKSGRNSSNQGQSSNLTNLNQEGQDGQNISDNDGQISNLDGKGVNLELCLGIGSSTSRTEQSLDLELSLGSDPTGAGSQPSIVNFGFRPSYPTLELSLGRPK